MAIVTLTPPSWTDGELLSATKLNALTDSINALKGLSLGPGPNCISATDTASYWSRRNYRWVHVRYAFSGGNTVRIRINGAQELASATGGEQWHTFDLDSVQSPPGYGTFYEIQIIRPAGTTLTIHEVRESAGSTPTATGSYVAPTNWASNTTAAEYLAKLQMLSAGVQAMSTTATPPSSPWAWALDTQTRWMRRRFDSLEVIFSTSNPGRIKVSINTDTIIDRSDVTAGEQVVFAFAAMDITPPAVGDYYYVAVEEASGSITVPIIREIATAPPPTYAPTFAHGNTSPSVATLNQMVSTLNTARIALSDVGWQYAQIYDPVANHPVWSAEKTGRYLHYLREGSLPAYILNPNDPNGPKTGLSRTGTGQWTTYDLDNLDWLNHGGLMYIYECDCIWVDDRA